MYNRTPYTIAVSRVFQGMSLSLTIQANLVINPKALLPGAAPRIPGAVGVLPGMTTGSSSGVSSSSLSPSPVTTPLGFTHSAMEAGVSFESPLQVATLQSTNKVCCYKDGGGGKGR